MDCNENTKGTRIKYWTRSLNLRDSTELTRQDPNTPATQHRGSFPIDGIFMSEMIEPMKGGSFYLDILTQITGAYG